MSEKKLGDCSIDSNHWPGTSKLLEEMGELQQVLGKLLDTGGEVKHWDGSNLRERLVEEIGDLRAALIFFELVNFTSKDHELVDARIQQKLELFQKWHKERTKQ